MGNWDFRLWLPVVLVLVFDAVQCMNLSFFLTNTQGFFLTPHDSDPITQAQRKSSKGRGASEAPRQTASWEASNTHHSHEVAIIG